MATKPKAGSDQPNFADLLFEIDEHPGQFRKLPFRPQDFGGELISILSSGLYTNPLDCIREYCQNSLDASAKQITIKIVGSTLSIFDDGQGMGFDELLSARMFGISPKDLLTHAGFRGIGIYSAFGLCRRLRITTSRKGDTKTYVLIFDFEQMKAKLDADRSKSSADGKTSLIDLLSEHTTISRLPQDTDSSRGFTMVELESMSRDHINKLSDRAQMQAYLLQSLPLDFNQDFEYRPEVNKALSQNINGFHPITVKLVSEDAEDQLLTKPTVLDLQAPQFKAILGENQEIIAYMWSCVTKGRGRIEELTPNSEVAGLVFKMKGFTIGNRQRLVSFFKRKPQLYPWVTGEIYVVDPKVIPNAERDDFESNHAKSVLLFNTQLALKEVEDRVEKHQAETVALQRFEKYRSRIPEIEAALESDIVPEPFAKYNELEEIGKDLSRQKNSLAGDDKTEAEELLKSIKRLQARIITETNSPTPGPEKKRKATKTKGKPGDTAKKGAAPAEPPRKLEQLVADLNLDFQSQGQDILNAVQAALEDNFSPESEMYRSIFNSIEARLLSIADQE